MKRPERTGRGPGRCASLAPRPAPALVRWLGGLARRLSGRLRSTRRLPLAVESCERRQLLSILFDADGPGPDPAVAVGSFGLDTGNTLARAALVNNRVNQGQIFQLYYQARLTNLTLEGGASYVPPGLNGTAGAPAFEITVVASVTEVVQSVTADGLSATFALAPTQSPNSFVRFFQNTGQVSDYFSGAGFTAGTMILSALPDANQGSAGNFSVTRDANGNPVPPGPLDLFDAPSSTPGMAYAGVSSVSGAGSAQINSLVQSLDNRYFLTSLSTVVFDSFQNAPFNQITPSSAFNSAGTPNSAPTIIPDIGAVNGFTGPDFQFQSRATVSLTPAQTPPPGINLVKMTNGVIARTPTGPTVPLDGTATFSYVVTNPGGVPLSGVTVRDDAGTPGNPADDFNATFVGGDTNGNGLLDLTETWTFTATRTATTCGQYENIAVAQGFDTTGTPVTAQDISHYFTPMPPSAIAVTKTTTVPPAPVNVIGVDRLGVHHQTTRLVLHFSGSLDPARAQNLANYTLSGIGRDRRFGTADDTTIALTSAVYNPAAGTVTLTTARPLALDRNVLLRVNGTAPNGLTDPAGNLLDGNGDGAPGGDFLATIGRGNLRLQAAAPTQAAAGVGPQVLAGNPVTFNYVVTNPDAEPLANVRIVDDSGTPGNPADDFIPTFTGGDTNGNGLLDPGERWTYTASRPAIMGQYTNTVNVAGTDRCAQTVAAAAISNYVGVCPTVVGLTRFGVHNQPTQIVLTYSGPVDAAVVQNLASYRLVRLGPDGVFGTADDRSIPLKSAVYDPTARTLTLTTARPINVHHLYQVTAPNPCPPGPAFTGILDRRFSLAQITQPDGRVIPVVLGSTPRGPAALARGSHRHR